MIDLEAHGLVAAESPPRPSGGPTTIAALLDPLLAADPDREILVGRSGRLTVAELDEAANRAAHALGTMGMVVGDRVAASLPNDCDVVVAFLGATRAGAIWVGLNRPLAAPEKAYMLADSSASVFIGGDDMTDQVRQHRSDLPDLQHLVTVGPGGDWADRLDDARPDPPGVSVDPSSPAAIAYTSGTTGFPKGAVHTQHNLLVPGAIIAGAETGITIGPDSVLGVPLPLTILNLMILGPLSAYQAGASLVAMDRLDAVGMAEWIEAEKITSFSAVPAMVHDLLTHPEVTDEMLSSIAHIGVGGADMPEAFRRLYEKRFGRRAGTGYGLTEAPTAVTAEDPTRPAVAGSCGVPLPQIRITIRDDAGVELPAGEVGEVCVEPSTDGPFADVYRPMLGYWNRPDDTARALRGGILFTGDLGQLDLAGNLFIKDRRNDLILRGGANVYPAEVERVLHDHPGVAACAVIGVPDERLGERVVAYVEPETETAVQPEQLREHCRSHLAAYKVPETITLVDGFDRTPMGKIRKTVLRQRAVDDSEAGVSTDGR